MPFEGDDFNDFYNAVTGAINKLPAQVANEALNLFKDNFVNESFFGEPWQQRKNADETHPLLRKRHTLYDALDKDWGEGFAMVYVNDEAKDYAGIHNNGGIIKMKPSAQQKKMFWAMWYRTKNEKYKAFALSKELTIVIPKRQFLGDHPQLQQHLEEYITNKLIKELSKFQ